jgi:hypothetical protein
MPMTDSNARRDFIAAAGLGSLAMMAAGSAMPGRVIAETLVAPAEERPKHHIRFAVCGMSHDHIYGMIAALQRGGGELVAAWGTEADKLVNFGRRYPNGIKFYGTQGWIFVSRGNEAVTKSDPVAKLNDATALAASDPKIVKSGIGPDEIHLYESKEHHGNWLDSIITRREPASLVAKAIAPAQPV